MTQLIVRHLLLSGIGVGALLLVALALRLLAPRDAVLRYRLMVIGLLAAGTLLPLQALTAELAPPPSPLLLAAASSPPASTPGTSPAVAAQRVLAPPDPLAVPFASLGATPRGTTASRSFASTFLLIYVVGAAAVVGIQAVRALAVRRLLRRARPVIDPRVLQLWGRIVVGLRRPPDLLECDGLHAPACRTMGRPAVIVPMESGSVDDDTLLAALRHELIHLQRRDGAVALLAALMSAILWFQPLVWVFARVLRADREHSCDALVVRATRHPRSYALALLRFCNPPPPASSHRVMSLIGFESARSIRRRITMLAHALQPAARPRRALVLGAGLACLVSASAAHALLTAAAGPGPALNGTPAARPSNEPPTAVVESPRSPRMTAEVPAMADGRTEEQVFRRLVKQGVIAPSDLPPRDAGWSFAQPGDNTLGVRTSTTWVTDQETVLSATDARADGNALYANRVRLSLPEGSKLRAIFEGETVNIQPGSKDGNRIVVIAGAVRIVDEAGETRVQARANSERSDATLTLISSFEGGEFNFELTATAGSDPVPVRLESRTAVPDGDRKPTHGAIRWKLTMPQDGPGACELKMQWIYEVSRLAGSVGC